MNNEMTKVISVRVPMNGYIDLLNQANQSKFTISELVLMKLFSEGNMENYKNEIIGLKAALVESNERVTSISNERDTLNTALIESNEKVVSVLNERDTLNMALIESNERMLNVAKECDDLKVTSTQLEKALHLKETYISLLVSKKGRY